MLESREEKIVYEDVKETNIIVHNDISWYIMTVLNRCWYYFEGLSWYPWKTNVYHSVNTSNEIETAIRVKKTETHGDILMVDITSRITKKPMSFHIDGIKSRFNSFDYLDEKISPKIKHMVEGMGNV